MKLSTAILVGTLVANAALVAFLFSRQPSESQVTKAAASTFGSRVAGGRASDSVSKAGTDHLAANTAADSGTGPSTKELAEFFGGDIRDVIARLRAAGYPAIYQSMVANAMLSKEMEPRIKALPGFGEQIPFWKSDGSTSNLLSSSEYRALSQEMSKAMQEVMGDSMISYFMDDPVARRAQFGDLPLERVEAILKTQTEFNRRMQEAIGSSGLTLIADREKYSQIQKELREAIVKLLSPEELLHYDLRTSSTASNLRNTLQGLDPTEEEYLTLFKLRQPFDEKWNSDLGLITMTPEMSQARRAEQEKLDADILAALTPDRAEEYKLLANSNYRAVVTLTDKLNLPSSAAREAIAIQKDIQLQMTAARRLPVAERNGELARIAEDADSRVGAALGTRGLAAYKSNSIGSWMASIVPQAPLPPPAGAPVAR